MFLNDHEALARLREHAKRRGIRVLEEEPLGHGSDGAVWKTGELSAVKAFFFRSTYGTELECY